MKLIQKDIDKIIILSQTLKQVEIAKIYKVSQSTIGKILRKHGIKHKKNRLNLSKLNLDFEYFDEINSEKKAYWLGFIAADGCLKSNKLRITSKDIEILEKLKKDLKSEHKITTNKTLDKRTKKEYTSYVLQITSAAFTNKLSKYIPVNKSDKFILPNIKAELYPEFLAGMTDGDGSFGLKKDKRKTIVFSLISTKECLESIQSYLFEKLEIKKSILQRATAGKNVWKLYVYSGAFDLLNLIYRSDNKEMYLNRKQERLNNIKQEKQ